MSIPTNRGIVNRKVSGDQTIENIPVKLSNKLFSYGIWSFQRFLSRYEASVDINL